MDDVVDNAEVVGEVLEAALKQLASMQNLTSLVVAHEVVTVTCVSVQLTPSPPTLTMLQLSMQSYSSNQDNEFVALSWHEAASTSPTSPACRIYRSILITWNALTSCVVP